MDDLVSLLAVPDVGNGSQESHAARQLGFREIVRPSFGKTDGQIELAAHFCAIVVELILNRRQWTFSPDVWHGHPPSTALLRDTARSMPGVGQDGRDAETRRIREMRFRILVQTAMKNNSDYLGDTQIWALKQLRDAPGADQVAAMRAIVSTMPDPRLG